MKQAYVIAGLLLGVILTVFALQNTGGVEVRSLFWQARGPLAAVVLLSVLGGLVVALLFGVPEIVAARWRIRTLERRLEGEGSGTAGTGTPPLPPPDAS